MRFTGSTFAAAAVLGSIIAGCSSGVSKAGPCDRASAQKLAGEAAPSDERLKELTGARTIRRIAPGQPTTKDFRPDRLTVEVENGRVVSAQCG